MKHYGQHVIWTDEKRVELPIRMGGTEEAANFEPITMIDLWKDCMLKYAPLPALSVKRNGKWRSISY